MKTLYFSEIVSERYRKYLHNLKKADTMPAIAHQSIDQTLKFGEQHKFLVSIKPDIQYVNHILVIRKGCGLGGMTSGPRK